MTALLNKLSHYVRNIPTYNAAAIHLVTHRIVLFTEVQPEARIATTTWTAVDLLRWIIE